MEKNIQDTVKSLIEELKAIANTSRVMDGKWDNFILIRDKLREYFRSDKHLFSDDVLKELKKNIEKIEKHKELDIDDTLYNIKEGMKVYHKREYYVGKVVGTTKIRQLFENQDDEFEYRIEVFDDIRIVSKINLKPCDEADESQNGTSEKLFHKRKEIRCYGCGEQIFSSAKKCGICNWRICPECLACGCGYNIKNLL